MTTLAELRLLCQVRGAKEFFSEQFLGKVPPESYFDPDMLQQVALDAREMLARLAEPPKPTLPPRYQLRKTKMYGKPTPIWSLIEGGYVVDTAEQPWPDVPEVEIRDGKFCVKGEQS